jgi:hypothetical protein
MSDETRSYATAHHSSLIIHHSGSMTPLLGRFLQMIGMILLPIGLMVGLLQDNVALEVRLLFIGGGFFVVGWLMARKR